MHLIYRARAHEKHSKDYEFSRLTMQEHWRDGYHDAVRTLRHPEALKRPTTLDGVATFDLAQEGRGEPVPLASHKGRSHERERTARSRLFDAADEPGLSAGAVPLHQS